ncbi:serine hydrolase domain-containing protein [Methanobacterium sp.]|uniref:serine hydrolase domain-containing protein n=1 Tax=Methanobacterium sp. TaxID=2164 RepID=UPI002AB982D6|nr:serine hydrolase domain-containing protein [Methanobacterium sp.]MDY9924387.1 serine hydrolase domain-containing protein [Methanobacterium sp.]
MDDKVSAGIFIFFTLVVVVVGVLIFNPLNLNTNPLDNELITVNQTGNNTTSNYDILPSTTLLTSIPFSPGGYSQSSLSSMSPSVNPSPGPEPSPDPMDHIISLFDQYIKSYYNQSLIPGMAVVIVQNDKILYMNCLGVKDLASGEPVDENTLFGICSITKQFSATNIAQLVDKGLMNWTDPITDYYSAPDEFQLYDDYVTGNITINDCLIHNSGLPVEGGNDYPTYFNDSYSAALYKLRYMENTTPFRSTVQYNSMLYALPGYCAARTSNTTWNELIKNDLLDPLGMTTATTSYYDFMNSPNHVTPYKLLKNGTMKAYDVIPDPIGPAGSMACSISEMANWLRFQIADTGYYNGVQIVSKKELDETRTGKMYMNAKNTSMIGYGWGTKDNGTTIYHDGDSDAFFSQITIYTTKDLGIVILSNGGQYAYNFKICLDAKFRELLKDNDAFDPWPARKNLTDNTWIEDVPDQYVDNPQPLSAYVGEYSHSVFGLINITTNTGTLICNYGNNSQSFDLKHWSNTTFEDPTNNHFFNFTDFQSDGAQQVEVTHFSFPPENGTFNRTS